MKVNNLPNNPRWKISNPKCTCEGKLDECIHCKYTLAFESIPSKNFKVNRPTKEKPEIEKMVTITEITLQIGRHGDVIGWSF
jgi:hypothetical protein